MTRFLSYLHISRVYSLLSYRLLGLRLCLLLTANEECSLLWIDVVVTLTATTTTTTTTITLAYLVITII
jgi:hypothetical protein